MIRVVKLTKRAEKKIENLLSFLELKWSQKVKSTFISKLEKSISQIQKHPDSFPESGMIKGLRKCVITRQTTIFYKYTEKEIFIITVFDNRQNPDSLYKESGNSI